MGKGLLLGKYTILVTLASNFGYFAFEIKPHIHEIIKLELKSYPVVQSAGFYLYFCRFERVLKMGLERFVFSHLDCHPGSFVNLLTPRVLQEVVNIVLVGKKVEVSLQLFDIFKRNMVFIFL